MRGSRLPTVALALSLSILSSGSGRAQAQTGNLSGTVADDQGRPLSEALLTLTGGRHPQVLVTDREGRFRFPNLDPGDYALKVEMDGYSAVEVPGLAVRIGRNVTLELTMNPAAEDVVTVTAEAPLLDERRIASPPDGAPESADIPTARDPWALLQSVPGVQVDRINVGGNEGGCGSAERLGSAGPSVGQGFAGADELIATRMSAAGSLPSPFDFNAFTELPVQALDPDRAPEAAGPPSSLRPKRGTNEWRANGSFQAGGAGLAARRRVEQPGGAVPGDRPGSLRAGDAWLGGPLRPDQLWFWGEAGFHRLDRIALGGQREERTGRSGRAKLNSQIGRSVSVVLAGSRGDADGSGVGAAPDRAPETAWDEDGREAAWAAEGTVVVSSDFFVTADVAAADRHLDDRARDAFGPARIGLDGVARGGWFDLREAQRSRQARSSATLFTDAGSVSHEILLGAGRREQDEDRSLALPLPLAVAGGTVGLADGFALAELWRSGEAAARTGTAGLWAQDTLEGPGWTAVLGLHADRQNPGVAGGRQVWTILPRLAVHRAFGENRSTRLSASFGRYASRLGPRAAWHLDAGGPAVLRARFADLDRDLALDPGEPLEILYGQGLDPLRPGVDPDAVDARLRPEIADEAVLGAERALTADLTVGVHASWRQTRQLLEERLLVREGAAGAIVVASSGDWVPAGRLHGVLPDGTAYDVPVFDLRPGLLWTGGTLLVNGDRRRDDLALSLTWKKRLADRWMSEGHVTWRDGDQRLGPAFRRFDDPTNTGGGGDDEGLPVTELASGRPHELPAYQATRWSFHALGFVVLREAGPTLAVAVDGRQGYPLPYYRRVARERAGLADVQLTGRPDAVRTGDVVTADAQLEQEFPFRDAGFAVSLEVSNLFNAGTVRRRELDLGTSRGAFADETLASRALRLKARLWWR